MNWLEICSACRDLARLGNVPPAEVEPHLDRLAARLNITGHKPAAAPSRGGGTEALGTLGAAERLVAELTRGGASAKVPAAGPEAVTPERERERELLRHYPCITPDTIVTLTPRQRELVAAGPSGRETLAWLDARAAEGGAN